LSAENRIASGVTQADADRALGPDDLRHLATLGRDLDVGGDRLGVELEPRELEGLDLRAQDRDVTLESIEDVDELGTLHQRFARGGRPLLECARIVSEYAHLDRLGVAGEIREDILQHLDVFEPCLGNARRELIAYLTDHRGDRVAVAARHELDHDVAAVLNGGGRRSELGAGAARERDDLGGVMQYRVERFADAIGLLERRARRKEKVDDERALVDRRQKAGRELAVRRDAEPEHDGDREWRGDPEVEQARDRAGDPVARRCRAMLGDQEPRERGDERERHHHRQHDGDRERQRERAEEPPGDTR